MKGVFPYQLMWHETEISSELEWMLGSGQATPAMLAEVLVEHFYAPVYRFSLVLLGNGEAATAAFQTALVSAISKAPRYQQSASPQVWFFRMVLEAIQNIRRAGMQIPPWSSWKAGTKERLLPEAHRLISALDQEDRLLALFGLLLGLEVTEIVSLTGQSTTEVTTGLDQARNRLAEILAPMEDPAKALQAVLPAPNLSPENVREIASEAALQAKSHSLRTLWSVRLREFYWLVGAVLLALIIGLTWSSSQQSLEPSKTPPPLNTPTPAPEASIPYYVQAGDTTQSISNRSGLSLAELFQLNPGISRGPLPWGQQIQVPMNTWRVLAAQSSSIDYQPVLLSKRSTSDEIREVLKNSSNNWKTLWVDAQITTFALPVYNDNPGTYTIQILVSQPDHNLLTIIPEDSGPFDRLLTTKDRLYYTNRDQSYSWYTDHYNSPIKWSSIEDLIFPAQSNWIREAGEFRIVDYAIVAGQPAVVIDWQSADGQQKRRLWVDAKTGVILYIQQFLDTKEDIAFSYYKINMIAYDVEVPPQVFSPQLASHLSDEEKQAMQNGLAGFDPVVHP